MILHDDDELDSTPNNRSLEAFPTEIVEIEKSDSDSLVSVR